MADEARMVFEFVDRSGTGGTAPGAPGNKPVASQSVDGFWTSSGGDPGNASRAKNPQPQYHPMPVPPSGTSPVGGLSQEDIATLFTTGGQPLVDEAIRQFGVQPSQGPAPAARQVPQVSAPSPTSSQQAPDDFNPNYPFGNPFADINPDQPFTKSDTPRTIPEAITGPDYFSGKASPFYEPEIEPVSPGDLDKAAGMIAGAEKLGAGVAKTAATAVPEIGMSSLVSAAGGNFAPLLTALGPVGAAAAGALAIAGTGAYAVKKFTDTLEMASDAIEERAGKYSPEIAAAESRAAVTRIQTDLELAKIAGGQVAGFIDASSRLASVEAKLAARVVAPALEEYAKVKRAGANILERANAVAEENPKLIGLLEDMIANQIPLLSDFRKIVGFFDDGKKTPAINFIKLFDDAAMLAPLQLAGQVPLPVNFGLGGP